MKFIVWLTIRLLNSQRITGEQKTRVMASLLKNIHAIPIHDVVSFTSDKSMIIDGKRFDAEQARLFVESIDGLKNSYARKVINAQLTYMALKLGVKEGLNPEQIQFSKAVLWFIQEENNLIEILSLK